MSHSKEDRTAKDPPQSPSGCRRIARLAGQQPPPAIRTQRLAILSIAVLLIARAGNSHAQSVAELRSLSLEDLASIQITTVSKSTEPLSDAPAAVYVITHEDIVRSGATSIPEMLRMAPNLEVVQLNATSYAISARGFNVGENASLSNKLLVLIDGRSVYTPLFGGVYWDMIYVPPDDIDHIEVISGPGATLWGANAVNGVINIITRKSSDTQGGLLTLGGGNLERDVGLQYSGRITPDLTYRVHAEYLDYSALKDENGSSADDGWSKPQGGFRLDWTPTDNAVNLEGDIYTADENPNGYIQGRDAQASWQHQFQNGSNLQIQAFGDDEGRSATGGSGFKINTYDFEAQHSITLGINDIVWGAGERNFSYHFENTALQLVPPNRDLNLVNLFAQDTISVTNGLKLTPGLKVESEPYAGVQYMPSVRLAWKVTDSTLLWSAVSRALRSPTPVDESIREYSGSIDVLNGSALFLPEKLTAYEAGARVQATAAGSFSISTYYNVYDDLRSIEPSATFFPLQFRNMLGGHVYGVEFWGDYRVTDWWRLTAGFNLQHENLRFAPTSSQIGGLAWVADDPNHQVSLRSSVDLGSKVTWDTSFRYVGRLPDPVVPAYAEVDTRLGWQATEALELSIAGNNLLHPQHEEFFEAGETDEIPRSFYLAAQWRF